MSIAAISAAVGTPVGSSVPPKKAFEAFGAFDVFEAFEAFDAVGAFETCDTRH